MSETYGTNRISLLFVDSEYQRKGIATAIMSRIASEPKMRGYKQKLNCREQKISVWPSDFIAKEVALFSAFGIIYAWQHFGNRKSVSPNKLCN